MFTWTYNENDEIWQHDIFKTEDECILDAKENYGFGYGETIAIGTVVPYTVFADVDTLLERLEEDAYEECGEVAEGWEISSRKHYDKEMDKLQEEITECINKYLLSIKEMPSFYKIDDIYTVEVR